MSDKKLMQPSRRKLLRNAGLLMGAHSICTFAAQPPELHPAVRSPEEAKPITLAAPPPPRLGVQLSVAPTVLAFRDHTGDKVAPGIGALLRF